MIRSIQNFMGGKIKGGRILLTIYFLEHSKHVLKVAMVHEPDTRIFLIFLEGHWRERRGEEIKYELNGTVDELSIER